MYVEAGQTTPIFDGFLPKMPLPTDEVVMEVLEENNRKEVVAWGYARFWRKAENTISRRPRYRVTRENRFQGQMMKNEARKEIFFEGNLDELISLCPRDGLRISSVDKLAPVYKTGPVTAKHRFEVKQNGSDWTACDDPRPFPEGQMYRLTYWKEKGSLVQLAMGTALAIDAKFPHTSRDQADPLLAYQNSTTAGESEGYLYWERYDASVPQGERPWTEVADPRPVYEMYAKVSAPSVVVPTPKVTPMPAAKKPRQFSKTMKSLEELVA
jgi:hypothetical protein